MTNRHDDYASRNHWSGVWTTKGESEVSWFQSSIGEQLERIS